MIRPPSRLRFAGLIALSLILILVSLGPSAWAQTGNEPTTPPPGPGTTPVGQPVGSNPTIRVGLVVDRPSVKLSCTGPFQVVNLATGQVVAALPLGEVEFTVTGGVIRAGAFGSFAGPVQVAPVPQIPPGSPAGTAPQPVAFMRLDDGPSYRGEFRISLSAKGLTAVDQLPLEDYLRGVVPREMPASWAPEALKAQAVAARSYALYQMSSGGSSDQAFDLLATVDSQVFGGIDGEDPRTDAAVQATAGQVITYNGWVADALFHASSGGHTENAEIVFSAATPYLRGVPDFDQSYQYYDWTAEIPLGDLEKKVNEGGYAKGRLYAAAPAGTRGVSGRYTSVRLTGSFGTAEMKANDFRRILNLRSTLYTLVNQLEHWEDTPSPLTEGGELVVVGAGGVTVKAPTGSLAVLGADGKQAKLAAGVVINRRLVPAGVRVDGRGYGHGLGMSQAGAQALAAQKGYNYQRILQYYYQGVKVEVR
ncbi:MAG TPA: SpoIID/LytB domain-containing protein [Bacillota bacterium]